MVSLQAQEKNVQVDIQLNDLITKEVLLFDDLRIRSIIQNLIMNAIKFSRQGGKIELKAKFTGSKREQITLSVQDNGIGMTDEIKESVFTMFRNITRRPNELDDNSSNNTRGPGLGLTYCKSMIERLGG